jgi:hypothetical protein
MIAESIDVGGRDLIHLEFDERIFDRIAHPLEDFADAAALISELDLVISVDTAIAHLAGALGKAVWILLPHVPDWRWMQERCGSPWYPTASLYRQSIAGDWADVFERIARDLERFLAAHSPVPTMQRTIEKRRNRKHRMGNSSSGEIPRPADLT